MTEMLLLHHLRLELNLIPALNQNMKSLRDSLSLSSVRGLSINSELWSAILLLVYSVGSVWQKKTGIVTSRDFRASKNVLKIKLSSRSTKMNLY